MQTIFDYPSVLCQRCCWTVAKVYWWDVGCRLFVWVGCSLFIMAQIPLCRLPRDVRDKSATKLSHAEVSGKSDVSWACALNLNFGPKTAKNRTEGSTDPGRSKRFERQTMANMEIVDSRLRPQWCFHLSKVTEMEEMLDCKLDALIRSFAWEKKRFSCQHKSARITWPLTLTLTLSTPCGCTLTWSPSCASLVVIRLFACENWWSVQIHTNSVHCVHCGQTDCNTSRRRYRGRAK